MTSKDRIRIQITISCPDFPFIRFCELISPLLSRDFGGATFDQTVGCWSKRAYEFSESYLPSHTPEPGVRVTLTVLLKDKQRALLLLRRHLKEVSSSLSLEITWVHTELLEVEIGHFKM